MVVFPAIVKFTGIHTYMLFKMAHAGYNTPMQINPESTSSTYRMPPLSDEFLYQIIFCMEDQSNEYFLDLKEGTLSQADFIAQRMKENPDRFLTLPEWYPSDGFRTMEKFVSTLRNPIYRERLRAVLQSGKGVFRQFKDVLHEQPPLERLWYFYKDKEIRRRIYLWYEGHDEAFRLTRLGEAPDDPTTELIKEDFILTRDSTQWSDPILRLGERAIKRLQDTGRQIDLLLADQLTDAWKIRDEDQHLVSLTTTGQFTGFLRYRVLSEGVALLVCFGIEDEFQGLGLFRYLFDSLCEILAKQGMRELIVSLAADALKVEPMFETVSPTPLTKLLSVSIPRWCDQFVVSDLEAFV